MNEQEKAHILIVDDRPENLISLEAILDAPNLKIIKASSGNEALGLMLEYEFVLVLLDVQMPEMDGFETAELMRMNVRTKHIPIIFVTAISKDQQHVFRGYEAGAVDYIFKPLEPEILKNKVRIFLELDRQKMALCKQNNELKSANQKILEQQKAAIEEERLKVLLQMSGATAHELNQPLMVLLGNIELLELKMVGDIPPQLERTVLAIKEAGNRISDTVKKIQTLRRVELKPYTKNSNIININQKINLLSVEPGDDDFKKLHRLLENQQQIKPFRVKNMEEAYSAIAKRDFDIILLEYILPDGTGLVVLSELAKKDIAIPVAVITDHGDEVIASKMIQAGAYEYLPKEKLSTSSLKRIIRSTLEKAALKAELNKVHEKMAAMATTDELTKLFNRRYFGKTLENEFKRANRYHTEMTLLMADIDHLKKTNNTYGYQAGDMVLEALGKLFLDVKRKNDAACRYGGEEFAVILPNTNEQEAWIASERYREKFAGTRFQFESDEFSMTLSIGVASSNGAKSHQELISRADHALYQAKKAGGNQTVLFSPNR